MGWFGKKRRNEATAPAATEGPASPSADAGGWQAFPSPGDDPAMRHQELMGAIIDTVVASPQLGDPAWATYSLAAEVSDGRVAVSAYRYAEDGSAMPTDPPEDLDAFAALWHHTRDTADAPWDVLLVKIHRDSGSFVSTFHYGEDANRFKITPDNIGQSPDLLRPTPEDFADPA